MGRAFPELQMTTFGMHGVSATPMVLGDDKGNSRRAGDDQQSLDRAPRALLHRRHGRLGAARLLPDERREGEEIDRARHAEPLRRSRPKRCARRARATTIPVEAIRAALGAEIIFNGRVKDVLRRTVGGFARGEADIRRRSTISRATRLQLAFQNEFLIAERDGKTLVTTPDMITLLEAETGAPVTADAMRYGIRVAALAFPCAEQWRTPKGLELVGPRYFGYDVDFQPFTPGAK